VKFFVPGGEVNVAILIPTRGRAAYVARTWKKKMFLNHADVHVGIEHSEKRVYADALPDFNKIKPIFYSNPLGSVALAREQLRIAATCARTYGGDGTPKRKYDFYVVTDDNATFDRDSLHCLVHAAATSKPKPVIMAGMHSTAPHFDRGAIAKGTWTHPPIAEMNGREVRSYATVAMIFQCYPHSLYAQYRYPPDAFGLDDRHFILWCVSQGLTRDRFRVCMDAPFSKSRYQAGGQGALTARIKKNGAAIARLAADFPDLVGMAGTLPLKWQFMFKYLAGETADRLPGGSMRKEARLFE